MRLRVSFAWVNSTEGHLAIIADMVSRTTQTHSHFQAVSLTPAHIAQPVARPTTLASVGLRSMTIGTVLLCVAIYSIATAMVELLWNASTGDLPAIADSFSLPLLISGAIGGIFFMATTPTARRLNVHAPVYLLAQAGSGVVWISMAYLIYYLFVGALNLPFLPRGIASIVGVVVTPMVIVFNALPWTLGIGSITGGLAGVLLMKRK